MQDIPKMGDYLGNYVYEAIEKLCKEGGEEIPEEYYIKLGNLQYHLRHQISKGFLILLNQAASL
jgi:hypothetical protein